MDWHWDIYTCYFVTGVHKKRRQNKDEIDLSVQNGEKLKVEWIGTTELKLESGVCLELSDIVFVLFETKFSCFSRLYKLGCFSTWWTFISINVWISFCLNRCFLDSGYTYNCNDAFSQGEFNESNFRHVCVGGIED